MTQFVTNDVISTDAVNATSIAACAVGASGWFRIRRTAANTFTVYRLN